MKQYIACATYEVHPDGSKSCVGIFEASKNDHLNFRMIYGIARDWKTKPEDEVIFFKGEAR